MSTPIDAPVLLYMSKNGCSACTVFEKQWENIKKELHGKARLIKFTCNEEYPPPSNLYVYSTWFPSIILAGPKSYFRCFTLDDKVNDVDYKDTYVIKAKKFNAVKTGRGFTYAGRPNTSEGIIDWYNRIADTIPSIDELTPPSKYEKEFNTK